MTYYFKLLFGLLFPLLMGYSILSLILRTNKIAALERLALSYLIGFSSLSLSMLFLGILRVPFNVLNIVAPWTIIICLLLIFAARKKLIIFDLNGLVSYFTALRSFRWYEACIVVMIGFRIMYSFIEALLKPVWGCDSFYNWSLRAKVFFYENSLSLNRANGLFMGGGGDHADYPLNIPLFETWLFKVLGTWDDAIIKIIFPLFLLAFIIVFYFSLRRFIPRLQSLFGTYLLTALPLLVFHSTIEYSDLPSAVFFVGGFLFLLRYIKENNPADLVLFSLLSAFTAWTKNEGLMLTLINFSVLLLFIYNNWAHIYNKLNKILVYLGFLAAVALPWYIFKAAMGVPTYGDQVPQINKAFEYASRIPIIINLLYNKALFYGHWEIAWFVFFIILIFSFMNVKRPQNYYTLAAIAVSFTGYFLVYYLTKSYGFLVDGTAANRNTLTYMPLLILYISLNLPKGDPAK